MMTTTGLGRRSALGAFLASLGKQQVPRIRTEDVPLPIILRREPRGALGMTVRESLTGRTLTVVPAKLRGVDERLQWGGRWSVIGVGGGRAQNGPIQ